MELKERDLGLREKGIESINKALIALGESVCSTVSKLPLSAER